MVTKMVERKSIHDTPANGKGISQKEDDLKSLTAKTKGFVDTAIKMRNDSMGSLATAAAYSFFMGIIHGRWEQANRLFRELPTIDADALRQKFAYRVNDKYAVDGRHDTDAQGNEIDPWIKRPTTMIVYLANPAVKGEHFSLAKAGEGQGGEPKRKLIAEYKAKVEAAGVEDLEAITWITREKVNSSSAPYDRETFFKGLKTLLIKAAKVTGDPESGLSTATIEAIMRDTAMPKAMKAEIREAYSEEPTTGKPDKPVEVPVETPAEKQPEQVAA